MRKAARVLVLILLLACSTQAGYMPNGSAQPTPTPTPVQTFVEEDPDAAEPPDVLPDVLADTLTEVALSVLDLALALL